MAFHSHSSDVVTLLISSTKSSQQPCVKSVYFVPVKKGAEHGQHASTPCCQVTPRALPRPVGRHQHSE